jgi:hypothetical protein
MRSGVGGGKGFRELTTAVEDEAKELPFISVPLFVARFGVSIVIDLMNVTWQISA